MDRNLPDIEELFKSALQDEEEMPEPKVWKAIENTLDKDDVISMKKKYEDLKKVALFLFFMLIGLGIYEFEKPFGSRNNNILKREIVSEKSSGGNSKNESNGMANKSAGSSGSANNKSKSFTDNSLVLESRSNKTQPMEQPSASADGKKQAPGYKRTILNTELSHQQRIKSKSEGATLTAETDNVPKRKLADRNIKSWEKLVLTDYSDLYAERLNQPKSDPSVTITLRRSPVLIKVISGIDNKTSLKESVKIKNKKTLPFSVNLFFSPDFASYRTENDGTGNNNNEASDIVKHEHHEFSSTTGALVDYKFKKHWSIQSGLTFSNTNISVSPKTIYASPDNSGSVKYKLNTSSGYGYVLPSFSNNPAVGDSLYAFSASHTLQYIGIPAGVKYIFSKGKFSFNATLGAALNILTKAKVETEIENGFRNEMEVVDNLQGMKKWYFSGFAGVGFDYNLNKKFAATFAPVYRFAVNPINQNTPVKSYPNSIGLTTGLRMNF